MTPTPTPTPTLTLTLTLTRYEKSTVYFAFDVKETDGLLTGRGDVYAAPKANPKALAKVGGFEAKRVTKDWDLRDARVAKIVTDKVL